MNVWAYYFCAASVARWSGDDGGDRLAVARRPFAPAAAYGQKGGAQ